MKLQVALDLVDLRKAVNLARELCSVGAEMIEAGTPLIKLYGMASVSAIKSACPKAEVVADIKTADVGGLEARLAREFGADWGTVLGMTNLETIVEFIKEGKAVGLKTAVDLIGSRDPEGRAQEILKAARPDLFIVHLGVDVQTRTGMRFEDLLEIALRIKNMGVGVAVAGGITERELELIIKRGAQVDVVVVGRSIVNDTSPASKFVMMNNILKHI